MATEERNQRVDVGGVSLVWGDKAPSKAKLRDEALETHLALPIAERLRLALSMVVPHRVAR